MKINAACRLRAATEEQILDSAEYLYSWFYQSWSIPEKYRTVKYVVDKLHPIVAVVGYIPKNKPLYRLVSSDKKDAFKIRSTLTLKPNGLLASYTYVTKHESLKYLAESIGADSAESCVLLEMQGTLHEVFNAEWILKSVVPLVRKYDSTKAANLKDIVKGYSWQGEVAAYNTSPVTAKVLRDYTWKG